MTKKDADTNMKGELAKGEVETIRQLESAAKMLIEGKKQKERRR
jgi:hypothetical protein